MLQIEVFHYEFDANFHHVFPMKIRKLPIMRTNQNEYELVDDDILQLNELAVLEVQ